MPEETKDVGRSELMQLFTLPVGPLFCSSRGVACSISGFASLWREAMDRVIEEGGIKFNEHDIRKTVAHEADNLEQAQRLLGH